MSIGTVIILAIGIFVVAALIPSAIELIEGVNHTENISGNWTNTWSGSTTAMWGIISLVCIVAVIYYVLPARWRGGKE